MKELDVPFPVYFQASDDFFCSREKEQTELLSALRNGRNVALMSERRMGKTAMIKNLFERLSAKRNSPVCIYVDIFSTKSISDFVQVLAHEVFGRLDTPFEKLVKGISVFLKSGRIYMSSDPLTGSPQIGIDFQPHEAKHTLLEIFAYLRSTDKHIYMAIDEFQQIASYSDSGIEAMLREQMQFSQNIRFIFSGSKQHLMNEIFTSPSRPFYRSCDKMILCALPRRQYCDFARKFFIEAGRNLPEEVFYEIYDRFEGHTWYVQYTLNRLWEQKQKNVSSEDINLAIEAALAAEDENFRNIYDNLTDNQCRLLRAIAKEDIVEKINSGDFVKRYELSTPSSVNRALQYLIDKELVLRMPAGYRVYDRFMHIWLKRLFY